MCCGIACHIFSVVLGCQVQSGFTFSYWLRIYLEPGVSSKAKVENIYYVKSLKICLHIVAAHLSLLNSTLWCSVQAAMQAVKEEEELPPPLPTEAPPRPPAPTPVSKWTLVDYDEDNPPADLEGCAVPSRSAHSMQCAATARVLWH